MTRADWIKLSGPEQDTLRAAVASIKPEDSRDVPGGGSWRIYHPFARSRCRNTRTGDRGISESAYRARVRKLLKRRIITEPGGLRFFWLPKTVAAFLGGPS